MKNITLATLAAVSIFATQAQAAAPQSASMGLQPAAMQQMSKNTTGLFKGVEANNGNATLEKKADGYHLRVSDDFKIPTSPAPHWQVVDGSGNVYLLQRFTLAGDKTRRDIVLPKYIKSVAKVQVWCSFAEVLLGEASFSKTVNLK